MRYSVIALLIAFLSGCTSYEQTERLEGIASVSPTPAGIEFRPTPALQVGVPDDGVISLVRGQESSFGDGYHVTIRLRYMGSADGRFRFRHETLHIPPGGPTETTVRYFSVPAYKTQSPNQPLQLTSDARGS